MKLMTKELLNKLPELYTTEGEEDKQIIVKFFTPWTNWTWYATEGSPVCPEHGNYDCTECAKPWTDFLFFGLVDGHEKEMGYFSLKEMEAVKGPFGLKIERDMYFGNKKLSDVR